MRRRSRASQNGPRASNPGEAGTSYAWGAHPCVRLSRLEESACFLKKRTGEVRKPIRCGR